jgi:hypothetical protein
MRGKDLSVNQGKTLKALIVHLDNTSPEWGIRIVF